MNSLQPAAPETTAHPDRCVTIRQLNDTFRQTFAGGRVGMTAAIAALPDTTRAAILAAVRHFTEFTPENDPHNEHDFGALTVGDLRVFWKIDSYDRALTFTSPDPADPAVTMRVLTVMLAEDY